MVWDDVLSPPALPGCVAHAPLTLSLNLRGSEPPRVGGICSRSHPGDSHPLVLLPSVTLGDDVGVHNHDGVRWEPEWGTGCRCGQGGVGARLVAQPGGRGSAAGLGRSRRRSAGFGMGREQAERSGRRWRVAPGTGGGTAGAASRGCRKSSGTALGERSAPSGSVSTLRAQGALHLGGLQRGLALLQLKPLELKRGCCCGDTRMPVAILWRHPS